MTSQVHTPAQSNCCNHCNRRPVGHGMVLASLTRFSALNRSPRLRASLLSIKGRLRKQHPEAGRSWRLVASPPSDHQNPATALLAHIFGHPQGAGVIGPGADGLLRAALVEALTSGHGHIRVITTQADLDRLLRSTRGRRAALPPGLCLHVVETLEDAIEHLEAESGPQPHDAPPSTNAPHAIWIATPGADADVVHQTLQQQGTRLTALLYGPWPYGPTHLIETDGPRLPLRWPISLMSAEVAAAKLQATRCAFRQT